MWISNSTGYVQVDNRGWKVTTKEWRHCEQILCMYLHEIHTSFFDDVHISLGKSSFPWSILQMYFVVNQWTLVAFSLIWLYSFQIYLVCQHGTLFYTFSKHLSKHIITSWAIACFVSKLCNGTDALHSQWVWN